MKPIYKPKGRAKEYGDYAINIYTGCPHRCYYCFAPNVLHKKKEQFHSCVEPRQNIVEEAKKEGNADASFYLAGIYEKAGDANYAMILLEEYIASGKASAEDLQ